jgi:crotonobetainyl-CoA hydratase
VVPAGEALNVAERWAGQICQNSPMSVRASKQAVMEGLNVTLAEAIAAQREYPAVREMIESADYIEGPKAFAEKRPPRWQGK